MTMTGKLQIPDGIDRPDFWEQFYRHGMTPWDCGAPPPPLCTFLDSPYKMPPGKLLVLGCGTGHDCLLFLKHGFQVTGIDFAPSAIQSTYKKLHPTGLLGTQAYLLQRDIFSIPEYANYFDVVVEHNCFCAIHPQDRRRYAYTVRDLLKSGGKFLALWRIEDRVGGGLPFPVEKSEIFSLFDHDFSIDISYQPTDSFPQDQGLELLTLMSKRS